MSHSSPHDAFVKAIFSHPQRAADAVRRLLPIDVAEAIDWHALEPVPNEFIGDDLSQRQADLLFKAPLADRTAYLVLLFEHQSTVDPWMALRVANYALRFWNACRAEHAGPAALPAVIPIVLYHGPAPWSAARGLGDLIDLPVELQRALGRHLLSLELVIDDLARTPDEAIEASTRSALVTAALLLKHTPYRDDPVTARMIGHLRAAIAVGEQHSVVMALEHIYSVSDVPPGAVERQLLRGVADPDVEEVIMTTAERLRNEGREKWTAEGRALMVIDLLEFRFGPLDDPTRARVLAADELTLARWHRRTLDAERLEDALEG